MSLFNDILQDVYTLTNRPHLVAESKLGIRVATIKLHTLEFWREDRVEEELPISVVENEFSLEKTAGTDGVFSYLPRPNGIVFKKLADNTYFDEISPRATLDAYGAKRFNTYYLAGSIFRFLTDTADSSIFCSYYRLPVATEAGYDSWIATQYQHYIAVEAALFVANSIGDKELEARMQSMAAMNLAQLTINHLDGN